MKIKTIFKGIGLIIIVTLLASMLLSIYISWCFIHTEKLSNIFGVSIVSITTGSMEPSIDEGDVILINNRCLNKADIGDIVTYKLEKGSLVTHRIIDKKIVNGKIIFQLQGDANNIPDLEWVPQEDILGIYQLRLHKLVYIIEFLTSPLMVVSIIILLASNRLAILFKKKIIVIRIKLNKIKK